MKIKTQSPSSFIFYCFTLVLTQADTISQNVLDLHSILSEKRCLSQIFLLTGFIERL